MPASTYSPCPNCEKVNRVGLDSSGVRKPVCGSCKTELVLHGAVSEISGSGLTSLLRSSPLPVIVDFWGPWCGPCLAFAPVFERVASRFTGQAVFVKINTQVFPFAGSAWHVRGVPTLIAFENGSEKERLSGALPEAAFVRWLETQLRQAA